MCISSAMLLLARQRDEAGASANHVSTTDGCFPEHVLVSILIVQSIIDHADL